MEHVCPLLQSCTSEKSCLHRFYSLVNEKGKKKKMYPTCRTGFLPTILKSKFNFSLIVGNIGLEKKNNTVKISVITHNLPFCGRKAHTIIQNILDDSGHFTSSRTAVAFHTSGSSTLAGELV